LKDIENLYFALLRQRYLYFRSFHSHSKVFCSK